MKHFNTKMSNLNSEEMDTMDYRPDCDSYNDYGGDDDHHGGMR